MKGTINYIELVGGKANSLHQLKQACLPVPEFLTIPYSAWHPNELDCYSAWPALDALCTQLELAHDAFAVSVLAAKLREHIKRTIVPATVLELVDYWINGPGGKSPLTFIRSSAASEDSLASSSAGQYESLVTTSKRDRIIEGILSVVESFYSSRAVAYRRSQGISQRGPKMGVVLQVPVLPDVSGVMFGCDPVDRNSQAIVVEGCWGLGTAIVSGAVTPDRFILNKGTGEITDKTLATKLIKDTINPNGDIERQRTSQAERESFCLNTEQLASLYSNYQSIEALFDTPQDVEWAFAEGKLWVLQSRPVTT